MTQAVALAQQASTGVSPGFRNRIINGAMVIDQRNAGASVTQTNAVLYGVDRWYTFGTVASKFTAQQNAGSVTPPAGFTNYLGITSSSAYSVGTSEQFIIAQAIEGYNTADLGFGTAQAKTICLSFWVRSSLTGTFAGGLGNNANDRSYSFTYTISSANTWEQKTVTIAGDTTGTWNTTNSQGIVVNWSMGTGSTYQSTANTWVAGNFKNVSGAVNIVGTNGATFYITGVQLEVGSTATSFDTRSYGQELILCQRYFEIACSTGYNNGLACSNFNAADTYANVRFVVTKRATPTVTVASPANSWNLYGNGSLSYVVTAIQSQNVGNTSFQLRISTSNQLNQGGASHLDFNTVTVANSGGWNASAEL